MRINYIHEPTDLQCGQAVLAMLLGVSVESICEELHNERETTLREMKQVLEKHGFKLSPERKQAITKADLPPIALQIREIFFGNFPSNIIKNCLTV